MHSRLILGVLLVVVMSAGTALADTACLNIMTSSQSLAALAANGNNCLVIGDKQFFNFQFIPDALNPTAVTAAGISVTTIGDGSANNLYGIDFGSQMGQLNNSSGSPSSTLSLDYDIKYSVQATGGYQIADVFQMVNGSALTTDPSLNPNSGIVVSEVAIDHGSTGASANSTVSINPNIFQEPPAQANDHLILNVHGVPTPVLRADITKDVRIDAGGGDKVTLSLIEQRFSQTPEPRSYALLLGMGFAALLWKKRASANVLS
jgi:hypothetical protein